MRSRYPALLVAAMGLLAGCSDVTEQADRSENNESTGAQTAFNVAVEAGATKELCFESATGDVALYRFEADAPLDFNLHYHFENEVYYPVPQHVTTAEKGQYIVPADQTYCLMWANAAAAAVSLSVEMNGVGAITWY